MTAGASVLVLFTLAVELSACADRENSEQEFADLQKKAAGGDVLAWYRLGRMHEQGVGVTQDKCQADDVFTRGMDITDMGEIFDAT